VGGALGPDPVGAGHASPLQTGPGLRQILRREAEAEAGFASAGADLQGHVLELEARPRAGGRIGAE
jgi:hypothetical protein